MINLSLSRWQALAIIAALQLGVLIYMVWSRVSLLQNGREITVEVIPVDPRDIFRGDYVVLGYGFARAAQENVPLPEGAQVNSPVYLTLAPDGEANWKSIAMSLQFPTDVAPDFAVIKGRVDRVWPRAAGGTEGRVRFGIESYFVPEGTGRDIENLVREKKVRAVLAIGSDGTAALKALEAGGKRLHEQPLL